MAVVANTGETVSTLLEILVDKYRKAREQVESGKEFQPFLRF